MKNTVFYGTRGSATLTQRQYMEFGGATTCLMVNLDDIHIMVDCGSGVCNAIQDLETIDELHLFISHCHLDHVIGLPTLLSSFRGKKLHIWGKPFQGIRVRDSLEQFMSLHLWPVHLDDYPFIEFHDLTSASVNIGTVCISNMDSNHPGGCSIFRFDSREDSIVSCFDFCHLDGYEEKLLDFAAGAKTLIYDGTFSEEELAAKPNYGHSTPEAGARIGARLGCREVLITHFGPYDDVQLGRWEAALRTDYPSVSFARSGQKRDRLRSLLDIGMLLNSEHDPDILLSRIVDQMMDITGADGGTLYLMKEDLLEFEVVVTKSMQVKLIKKGQEQLFPPVPIDGQNICAAAAREKMLINIPDCYDQDSYDLSGTYKYDERNDYHTKSVIVIPMIDENEDVIGVLQLINATDEAGIIVPFREEDEEMLMTIACQAGMAIRNFSHSRQVDDLLFGVVRMMSLAVDERSHFTSNHTVNMVRLAEHFLDDQNAHGGNYQVDEKKKREILMSVWLHDIGKILTPLELLDKADRLGSLYPALKNRFERRELLLQLSKARGEITPAQYDALEAERAEQWSAIDQINPSGFLTDDKKAKLEQLHEKTYTELDGSQAPVITEEEYHSLSIIKGTLTAEERSIVQAHVTYTQKFLSQLDFPKYYDCIPTYAGNHHEFLNGSGYPNQLTAADLPWPCRFLTVCDIFEALTAADRPYKKPMTSEKAFSILYDMADHGQLDRDLIRAFEASLAR